MTSSREERSERQSNKIKRFSFNRRKNEILEELIDLKSSEARNDSNQRNVRFFLFLNFISFASLIYYVYILLDKKPKIDFSKRPQCFLEQYNAIEYPHMVVESESDWGFWFGLPVGALMTLFWTKLTKSTISRTYDNTSARCSATISSLKAVYKKKLSTQQTKRNSKVTKTSAPELQELSPNTIKNSIEVHRHWENLPFNSLAIKEKPEHIEPPIPQQLSYLDDVQSVDISIQHAPSMAAEVDKFTYDVETEDGKIKIDLMDFGESLFGTSKPIIIVAINHGVQAFVEITKQMMNREPWLCYFSFQDVNANFESIAALELLENSGMIPAKFVLMPECTETLFDVLHDHRQECHELIHNEDASIVVFAEPKFQNFIDSALLSLLWQGEIDKMKSKNTYTYVNVNLPTE